MLVLFQFLGVFCRRPLHIARSQLLVFLDLLLKFLLSFEKLGNVPHMRHMLLVVQILNVTHHAFDVLELSLLSLFVFNLLRGLVSNMGRNFLLNFDRLNHSDLSLRLLFGLLWLLLGLLFWFSSWLFRFLCFFRFDWFDWHSRD